VSIFESILTVNPLKKSKKTRQFFCEKNSLILPRGLIFGEFGYLSKIQEMKVFRKVILPVSYKQITQKIWGNR
jgi:hypothetical protein